MELAPVTEWLPLKQSPARSSSATVAAALEALSIAGNSDETKEPAACAKGAAAGLSSRSQAWEGPDEAPEVEGLWRPSLKVAGGASGERPTNTLSEAGILAKQGNLQPLGKVVFILESNHRVSSRVVLKNVIPCLHYGRSAGTAVEIALYPRRH